MEHTESTFKGVRDLNIYTQGWLPDGKVKAVLLIVHGLGEHSGRYMNVVNHFVPQGYAIYGFDLIGHGKSEGGREQLRRFEDYTESLTTYHTMVKAWQPEKPIILLGHSVGGLIAAWYLIDHQEMFKGAIISGPSTKIPSFITPAIIAMAEVLSSVAPNTGIFPLDPNAVSRDPEVVKDYINDPLVFQGKTPALCSVELLKAMQRVNVDGDKINLPLIIVQGSEDKLADPSGAQELYDRISSKDKTLKIYPGCYHEIHNEPERLTMFQDLETWLKAHI